MPDATTEQPTVPRDVRITPALLPAAWVYAAIIALRNKLYDRGALRAATCTIPVISVGNLTVGGTGKTPHVIEIAQRLIALGARPAVITRGYRGTAEHPADEVLELRAALPNVPTIVAPNRAQGAADAVARGATCALLDDGFQHRRLKRDLDIVLIDALRPWGGGALLPAGRLREPMSSLRRSNLVIITRANQVDPLCVQTIRSRISAIAPHLPIIQSSIHTAGLADIDDRPLDPTAAQTDSVMLVAGVGNIATVRHSVSAVLGNRPFAAEREFPDHHAYNRDDVAHIMHQADAARAGIVVTTRKDWVKLMPLWPRGEGAQRAPRLVRLDIRVAIQDSSDVLNRLLRQALETTR